MFLGDAGGRLVAPDGLGCLRQLLGRGVSLRRQVQQDPVADGRPTVFQEPGEWYRVLLREFQDGLLAGWWERETAAIIVLLVDHD